MTNFGWDLPPGVTPRMIEEAFGDDDEEEPEQDDNEEDDTK